MIIKRFFSAQPTRRRLFIEILHENSGVILAVGVIASGTFGVGLYLNQLKIYEERLNKYQDLYQEKLSVYQEKLNVYQEKLNTVKVEAKKDALLAEEKAKKEALEHLYQIFTQEEYKEAKQKMLTKKNQIVNSE